MRNASNLRRYALLFGYGMGLDSHTENAACSRILESLRFYLDSTMQALLQIKSSVSSNTSIAMRRSVGIFQCIFLCDDSIQCLM